MKTQHANYILPLFTLITLVVLSGCVSSSGNLGRLVPDNRVKQDLESFIVPSGYTYYYYGVETFPQAFIGISPEYTLDSSHWQQVSLTSDVLRSWIWGHGNRRPGDKERYGSAIVGPNGEKIGLWYSLAGWQQWARIEMGEGGHLKIGTPIDRGHRKRPGDDMFF